MGNFISLGGHGGNGDGMLLGSKDDFLVPITLDLAGLPFEATGIVCGVAAKLSGAADDRGGPELGNGVGGRENDAGSPDPELGSAGGGMGVGDEGGKGKTKGPIEMSYLSTARAGTVMVDEGDLERAMEVLRVSGGGGC